MDSATLDRYIVLLRKFTDACGQRDEEG